MCEIDGEAINDVSLQNYNTYYLNVKYIIQITVVGRIVGKYDETMRVIFEIHDSTECFKVIFYQKGENQAPVALRDF